MTNGAKGLRLGAGVVLSRRRLVSAGLASAVGILGGFGSRSIAPNRIAAHFQVEPVAAESRRYFARTGHNLAEPFLSRWQAIGGEETVGAPISEERYAEGVGGVLQSFEGVTLLYDPVQATPNDIQGQPLAPSAREAQAPAAAKRRITGCSRADATCRFFPETGHTLAGNLGAFWASSGDEPIFGRPISEPFVEEVDGADVTIQVFEKAVLEDRGAADVRLRPIAPIPSDAGGQPTDPAFRPTPPTGGTTFLVGAGDGLRLRVGPSVDAAMAALLPENAEFIAATPWDGDWVPGYADGFAGWVAAEYLREAPPLPQLDPADWNPAVWQGASLGEANVRVEPSTKARVAQELAYGDALTVEAWVEGEEVFDGADMWARLGPGRFVYGRNVGRNAPVQPPPVPPDAPAVGRWIDVNLTQQLLVAYEARTPVRTVVTTTGMPGWETPPGSYQILWRVANETMTSGAIGAESFYKLEDVLFTQYFTDRGHALHFAWWRTEETIGRPGSHGCVNLLLEDARFFWDWATIGTVVFVHS